MTALNNIVPAIGVVQLDVLLLVDERLQLVHSLAAALERVQLVGVDVVLVEDLLPLSQDGERLAAVGADPRGARAVDHPLGSYSAVWPRYFN